MKPDGERHEELLSSPVLSLLKSPHLSPSHLSLSLSPSSFAGERHAELPLFKALITHPASRPHLPWSRWIAEPWHPKEVNAKVKQKGPKES